MFGWTHAEDDGWTLVTDQRDGHTATPAVPHQNLGEQGSARQQRFGVVRIDTPGRGRSPSRTRLMTSLADRSRSR